MSWTNQCPLYTAVSRGGGEVRGPSLTGEGMFLTLEVIINVDA
jgi:hypothetical protein